MAPPLMLPHPPLPGHPSGLARCRCGILPPLRISSPPHPLTSFYERRWLLSSPPTTTPTPNSASPSLPSTTIRRCPALPASPPHSTTAPSTVAVGPVHDQARLSIMHGVMSPRDGLRSRLLDTNTPDKWVISSREWHGQFVSCQPMDYPLSLAIAN
jgi:hypothetical protein